jgi:hypothetical protein
MATAMVADLATLWVGVKGLHAAAQAHALGDLLAFASVRDAGQMG